MKKGSITIEAAIIMPMVLMVVLTMLMAAVSFHDLLVADVSARHITDSLVLGEMVEVKNFGTVMMVPEVSHEIQNGFLFQQGRLTFVMGIKKSLMARLFGVEWDQKSKVRSPKGYLRLVDFADDATDSFAQTRTLKNQWNSHLEGLIKGLEVGAQE